MGEGQERQQWQTRDYSGRKRTGAPRPPAASLLANASVPAVDGELRASDRCCSWRHLISSALSRCASSGAMANRRTCLTPHRDIIGLVSYGKCVTYWEDELATTGCELCNSE